MADSEKRDMNDVKPKTIQVTHEDESGGVDVTVADAPSPDNETGDNVEAALEAARHEARETYDRLLRVSADFDNYRKRTAREMEDSRKYANETLIREMLPVVDNLERAIVSSTGDAECTNGCLLEGVQMTLKEIVKILERFGVKPVVSLGKPFDPNYHQALMQEETEDHPEHTVISELQKGYTLHDRLLRPALVVVSKKKTGGTGNIQEEAER